VHLVAQLLLEEQTMKKNQIRRAGTQKPTVFKGGQQYLEPM
jgi:hypothetical protein